MMKKKERKTNHKERDELAARVSWLSIKE